MAREYPSVRQGPSPTVSHWPPTGSHEPHPERSRRGIDPTECEGRREEGQPPIILTERSSTMLRRHVQWHVDTRLATDAVAGGNPVAAHLPSDRTTQVRRGARR